MKQLFARSYRYGLLVGLAAASLLMVPERSLGQVRNGTAPARPQGSAQQGKVQSQGKVRQGNVQQTSGTQPQRREQPIARQAANPRPTAPSNASSPAPQVNRPVDPHMPRWLPISPQHQAYINDLLKFWEEKSANVERYQCDFTRWRYDLGFKPMSDQLFTDVRGSEAASEIAKGVIKFEAPDKALFEVRQTEKGLNPINKKDDIGPWRFDPEKRDYVRVTLDEVGEHWICDGEHFYEFNYRQKQLRKIPLPPEARGDAIARGPLPFLFRAKANDISNRFWLRVVTPPNEKEAYHLEATPKTMADAAQFGRVIIILDKEEFLPKALIIYPVGSRADDDRLPNEPPQPPSRELYIFENRKVNPVLEKITDLNYWKRSFYEPKVPKGWKLSEEPAYDTGVADEQPQPAIDENIAPASALQAEPPARRPHR